MDPLSESVLDLYYKYESLESHDNFRILELLPGIWAQQITCKLHIFSINDHPVYRALSYCWGDPKDPLSGGYPSCPVLVNGKRLLITRNLYNALFRIRQESESAFIWADAICINQRHSDERNSQVAIMRKIYQQAQKTIIWLGEGQWADLRTLIPLLLKAGERIETLQLRVPADSPDKYVRILDICHLPEYQSYQYKRFEALFRQPWFQRVWVVQEVAVAKNATVFCGEEEIEWKDLVKALEVSRRLGIMPMDLEPGVGTHSQAIEAVRLNVEAGKSLGILRLLQGFRSFCATDSRDKVFALYGLAADCGPSRLDLKADYYLTKEEVYQQVAKALLGQSLDVLSVGFHIEHSLPSWVPDWSSRPGNLFPLRDVDKNDKFYCDFGASKDSHQELEIVGNTLVLQGHEFDFIKESTCVMDSHQMVRSKDVSFLEATHAELGGWAEWEKLANIHSSLQYVNGESNLDVYWQTLCAGKKPRGHEDTKSAFLEWRKANGPFRNMHRLGLNKTAKILSASLYLYVHVLRGKAKIPKSFLELMGTVLDRRLARTTKGYLALIPPSAQPNDTIAVVKGGKIPLVLRQCNYNTWQLLGDAYVHGIMYGEAFLEAKCKPIQIV